MSSPGAGRGGLASVLMLAAFSGCGQGAGQPTDLMVRPPQGWEVEPGQWMVPGKPLRAWLGPDGASLVWYRSLPAPGIDALGLARAAGNRLQNLPDVQNVTVSPENLTGIDAARIEAVGPGTGSAFVPSGAGTPVAPKDGGLKPTRRIQILVSRPGETSHLVFHALENQASSLESAVRETLAGLSPGAAVSGVRTN
ncbi:MAG: hypothetical protein U0835_27020 [Isosphaeraceae bacterium]